MEVKDNYIVIGVVGHIKPKDLINFKIYLSEFTPFRLVIFKESNNKLWLIERDEH